MTTIHPTPLLRQALVADAAASGACGILMLAGASPLSELLGLPAGLLRACGAVLIPYAVLVGLMGRRDTVARPLVWAVILCNAVWVADSLLLLMSGWVQPTALGTAFVLAQALLVGLFAQLQALGLRRSPAYA